MKKYNLIIKNYGVVYEYNAHLNYIGGHIDFIGKDKNKRCGNSFIAYIKDSKQEYTCAFDFPFVVPAYVNDKLEKIFEPILMFYSNNKDD